MNSTSGIMILTGIFWAASSAFWRRLTRISLDCTRSTWPTGMPNASACTIAEQKLRRSGRLLRSPSARRALERPRPICISCSTRANSLASGPSVLRATWDERGVEAEARLDRDRQQVEGVRAARARIFAVRS